MIDPERAVVLVSGPARHWHRMETAPEGHHISVTINTTPRDAAQ
jgi:hypothetical protein